MHDISPCNYTWHRRGGDRVVAYFIDRAHDHGLAYFAYPADRIPDHVSNCYPAGGDTGGGGVFLETVFYLLGDLSQVVYCICTCDDYRVFPA